MSYRSTVALEVATEKNVKLLKLFFEKFPDNIDFLEEHVARVSDDATLYLWLWPWAKWSDEYPEIRFIQEFLDTLNYEDFSFVRVGEYPDDYERQGEGIVFGLRIDHCVKWGEGTCLNSERTRFQLQKSLWN